MRVVVKCYTLVNTHPLLSPFPPSSSSPEGLNPPQRETEDARREEIGRKRGGGQRMENGRKERREAGRMKGRQQGKEYDTRNTLHWKIMWCFFLYASVQPRFSHTSPPSFISFPSHYFVHLAASPHVSCCHIFFLFHFFLPLLFLPPP